MCEAGFSTYPAYTTNADEEVRQLVAVANRSCSVLSRYPWQKLRKSTTIDLTADEITPGQGDYARPSDIRFYAPDTAYKEESIQWVDLPATDAFWAYLKANNSPQGVVLKARFENDLIYIHDPGGLSNQVRYEYFSKWPVAVSGSTVGTQERFQADDDEWLLDRDLIEMDLIWRLKKKFGVEDWEEDRAEFQVYEKRLRSDDSGAKTLIDGSAPQVIQHPADSPQANLYV